jgi:anti-anti-sigma factor
MARDGSFQGVVEKSTDSKGSPLTTIQCHGELVSSSARAFRDLVGPLIPAGGRIVLDLKDVKFMDSAGLGALVGLKASAIRQGECTLELANVTRGVQELLRLTHLTQMFL